MRGSTTEGIGRIFERFIRSQRELGWLYKTAPTHLAAFERFLCERQIDSLEAVDTRLLLDYQRRIKVLRSATTVNGYMSTLRALWRFLLNRELVENDVTAAVAYLPEDHFVPYLYSAHELDRIEQALREAIGNADTALGRLTRMMRRTVFGLLRDCGMRVSEACRLDVEHYDPAARTLRIERTKFFKTRIIPVPRSTCRSVDRYLSMRKALDREQGAPAALFVSFYRNRIGRSTLERDWKKLLTRLGLYRPRRRQGRTVFGSTNLHALRHSFAVRTLERWQCQGLEQDRLLPLLSGYMGHVQVSCTAVYLHLSPRLRETASRRFEDRVLPFLDRSEEP